MTIGTDEQLEIAVVESWFDRIASRLTARVGGMAYAGLVSVADQLVVSGTRFLTSIIVGRECGPQALGDYTMGFTLYFAIASAQGALISLPFTVYRHRFEGSDERAYSGSTLVHYAAFSLLVLTALGLAAAALALGFGPAGLAPLVMVLAITFPLALLVEFARRFALARFQMATVLGVDVAMSLIQIVVLLALASLGALTAVGAYVAVGVGAAIAGIAWLVLARPLFLIRSARIVSDARLNWRCGRWVLVRDLTLSFRSNSLLWLVALMLDATSTGIYVACDTLMRLATPIMMAVANVLFPSAALAFAEGDLPKVRGLVNKAALVLLLATSPFCVAFVFFGEPMLAKLFGEAYGGQGTVMALMAMVAITDALDTGAANGLLAIDRANVNFFAMLLGTVTMLVLASVLAPRWGLVGAAAGLLVGRSLTSTVQWLAFFRLANPQPIRRLP